MAIALLPIGIEGQFWGERKVPPVENLRFCSDGFVDSSSLAEPVSYHSACGIIFNDFPERFIVYEELYQQAATHLPPFKRARQSTTALKACNCLGVSGCPKPNYHPIIHGGIMKKEVVIVDYGTLRPDMPAYGQSMACYVCGNKHGTLNVARIKDEKKTTTVPVCPACVLDKDAVIEKHTKTPNP